MNAVCKKVCLQTRVGIINHAGFLMASRILAILLIICQDINTDLWSHLWQKGINYICADSKSDCVIDQFPIDLINHSLNIHIPLPVECVIKFRNLGTVLWICLYWPNSFHDKGKIMMLYIKHDVLQSSIYFHLTATSKAPDRLSVGLLLFFSHIH